MGERIIHWGHNASLYGGNNVRLLTTGDKRDFFVPALLASGLEGDVDVRLFYYGDYNIAPLKQKFEYLYNGKSKTLNVRSVEVRPEGQGAVALARQKVSDGLILSIDIGGGTSTIALWNGIDPIRYEVKKQSGVGALVAALRQTELARELQGRNTSVNYATFTNVVRDFATALQDKPSKEITCFVESSGIDASPYIRSCLKDWFFGMLEEPFADIGSSGLMDQVEAVEIFGGGAYLLNGRREDIQNALQRPALIPPQPELANLIGAELFDE